MAKPTERALKRKPMAVILLTTLRKSVPDVPDGSGGREFEWFDTKEGMTAYFDENVEFHKTDAKEHDDMAYLSVEIIDTASMKIGRIDVQPKTDETAAWLKDIKADVTKAFTPIVTKPKAEGAKVVRPRKKSTAAAAAKPTGTAAERKAATLKKRLATKKAESAAAKEEATT